MFYLSNKGKTTQRRTTMRSIPSLAVVVHQQQQERLRNLTVAVATSSSSV